MFVIAGTVTLRRGEREAFLRDREQPTLETRMEPGCLQYGYSADSIDPDRCLFVAIWQSDEAFDAHAAIVKRRNAGTTSTIEVLERNLTRYDVVRVSNPGE